ncbi:DUF4190 domain-containing protein [Planobispora takensis]|uniref:DUF4190 domain-containing protein n=1 Tax=Planobispora takensis TaxID=1367882 RepID=UPI001940CE33|nr:DUF4190 domain-containing protein [Planobispora takensis]
MPPHPDLPDAPEVLPPVQTAAPDSPRSGQAGPSPEAAGPGDTWPSAGTPGPGEAGSRGDAGVPGEAEPWQNPGGQGEAGSPAAEPPASYPVPGAAPPAYPGWESAPEQAPLDDIGAPPGVVQPSRYDPPTPPESLSTVPSEATEPVTGEFPPGREPVPGGPYGGTPGSPSAARSGLYGAPGSGGPSAGQGGPYGGAPGGPSAGQGGPYGDPGAGAAPAYGAPVPGGSHAAPGGPGGPYGAPPGGPYGGFPASGAAGAHPGAPPHGMPSGAPEAASTGAHPYGGASAQPYGAQPYAPAHPAGPGGYPAPPRGDRFGPGRGGGLGTAALVLGIVSLVLLLACGIGALTAIVGVIIGIVAVVKNSNRGRAWVGLILSALTLIIAAVVLAWFANKVGDCLEMPTELQRYCVEQKFGIQLQPVP